MRIHITNKLIQYIRRKKMTLERNQWYEIHLVDHCNLNCRGCSHFSPLSKENFIDTDVFKKDIQRLSELMNHHCNELHLLGGEPLLHPNINDFLKISRDAFPHNRILVITNAVLLTSMKASFWEACNKYDIVISITKYPINLDYEKIEKLAYQHKVTLEYFGNSNHVEKEMRNISLTEDGELDSKSNYNRCGMHNNCIQIRNGKLYPCTIPAYIELFNEVFHKQFIVSKKDFVDMNEIKSYKELNKKLNQPMDFCKYCNLDHIQYFPWQQSKCSIDEWLDK